MFLFLCLRVFTLSTGIIGAVEVARNYRSKLRRNSQREMEFFVYTLSSSREVQVNHLENDADAGPSTNNALLVVAAVFLAIPIVALLWVGSFAKVEPTLAGFPFFIWYQFLWVFLCAACTLAAYRFVRMARPGRKEARR